MAKFTFVSGAYPNGTKYDMVSMNGVSLECLFETSAGFNAPGWRKLLASKDDALEKLRVAGIKDRKRKIAALQSEVDKLEAT